jgi:D-alanyl-D-alanine carboxypeptidase
MVSSGHLPSRRVVTAVFRRLVAVLVAGIFTLTLASSSGAVQPTTVATAPSVAAPGSASVPAIASTGGANASPASESAAATPTPVPSGTAPLGAPNIPLPATPGPAPLPVAQLQARLKSIRAKYNLPGVSVTIIWPDGRTWTGVSGWADVGHKVKIVPGTAFSVGSVSKTFIATLILELVQEHKLSLDDRVKRWLPTARVSPQVTVRQLLNHTSGLYDFFENPKIDKALLAHPRQVWTAALALSYMSKPYCAPGTCWVYSNSNYVLLGQIAAMAGGDTPTDMLRQRFFDPLGMSRTFVQGVEPARGTVATAYRLSGTVSTRRMISLADGTGIAPFTSVVTAAGTAGDIAASSGDLARWARALYGGHVLSPASLAQMLDTSASRHVHAATPYGFAVSTISLGGRMTYGHNGRLIGSRASIRYLPATGFTVAVVTNQDVIGPDVFGTSLINIAIASLVPPQYPLPPSALPATSPDVDASPPPARPSPSATPGPPVELYPPN